jgi:hypothetical protein
MGKGTIQSHLGDGLYDLQLEFNKDRALAQKAELEERYDELYYDEVPELEADKDTAEQNLNAAEQDLNETIESGDTEAISEVQEPYLEALQAYSLATQALSSAKLELESVSAKIQSLSNIAATDSLTAWCADLTTDLSGEVGTVEVPGERDHVLIRPGHNGAAVYDAVRDGQIFPIKSTTPAATFYNLAMLPGWQKWRPQYRLGEITAIDVDTDTCDVTLDTESSSAQNLGVNQASTLSGIPIEYMTCNSAAFEVGDRVLVEFDGQRWSGAKVVGFESEPKACEVLVACLRPHHSVNQSSSNPIDIYIYKREKDEDGEYKYRWTKLKECYVGTFGSNPYIDVSYTDYGTGPTCDQYDYYGKWMGTDFEGLDQNHVFCALIQSVNDVADDVGTESRCASNPICGWEAACDVYPEYNFWTIFRLKSDPSDAYLSCADEV